jgi:serine phosphatase RsbU (regulator of sigma subunit)
MQMTIFKKIVMIVVLAVCFLSITAGNTALYAQLTNEQRAQVNQYNQLIKDYILKNQQRLALFYSNKKAGVYLKAGSYQDAIDAYLQSAELAEKIGNFTQTRIIYKNLALIYSEIDQLKNTQKYFDKALTLSRRLSNRADICIDIMDGTSILILRQEYNSALQKLEEALKIANTLNDPSLLRECYRQMALCYKGFGNQKKSDEYYSYFQVYDKHVTEKGTIDREKKNVAIISDKDEQIKISESERLAKILELSLLEERKKRTEDSLSFAIALKEDSILKIEESKKKIELELELKDKAQKVALQERKLLEAENDRQNLYIYGGTMLMFLLLLVIGVAMYALRQRRLANKELKIKNTEISKAKDEIETKSFELKDAMSHIQYQNKSIMQSINYAQRIQDAMLPKQIGMQAIIPESFIFFKPRDVVSGDFYWFEDTGRLINGAKNEKLEGKAHSRKIFIAAVDCTGHGVPGAFMSMLGFNLLNDIVRRGIHDSGKILDNLHFGIRQSLNQDETQNRDGMDMALCIIDPENKIMEFAGAQNPLIYIQEKQIFKVKPNKFPVGGFQIDNQSFTRNIIKLDKPTTFYISSDGFTDQFGGPHGRKFMAANYRDLLMEIHEMPMDEQKKILELVMNEWMGDNEQTDDVLVIGFKIDLENNPIYS